MCRSTQDLTRPAAQGGFQLSFGIPRRFRRLMPGNDLALRARRVLPRREQGAYAPSLFCTTPDWA